MDSKDVLELMDLQLVNYFITSNNMVPKDDLMQEISEKVIEDRNYDDVVVYGNRAGSEVLDFVKFRDEILMLDPEKVVILFLDVDNENVDCLGFEDNEKIFKIIKDISICKKYEKTSDFIVDYLENKLN